MQLKTPRPAQNKKRAFVVSPTMDTILRTIYLYHFLTVRQIMRLLSYSPNSHTRAQELLKKLADEGYLDRPKLPHTQTGKAPYIYCLTKKGLAYLEDFGFDTTFRFRPSEHKQPSYGYLKHMEGLNDFLITASFVPRTVSGITLDPFGDMQHEWLLKRHPVYMKISRDQGSVKKQETEKVIPDAWLNFGYPDGTHISLLVEFDRGSESREKFTRKIQALVRYVQEGYYKKQFGSRIVTIAFITPTGAHRRDMMLGYCEDVLNQMHKNTGEHRDLFRFAALPPASDDPTTLFFTPLWHRPFDYEESGNGRTRVKVYTNPLALLDMP